jgi:hypothetical protein
MDDRTAMFHEDFTTTLSIKPPQVIYPQTLYGSIPDPPQARYLDTEHYDDVYPPADEITAFVPEPAADTFVSNAFTELDHDPVADTATGSINQFTAEQTAAHKHLVNTLLTALGSHLEESLQQCMEVCVTASTKAAQAVIDSQKSPDESSVLQSDNTSAAPYVSPPPSLGNFNQNSVYDSVHRPTRIDTSFHTSAGSPPASQRSPPMSALLTVATQKSRKKAKGRRKKKEAARRAVTGTTSGWETRKAARDLDWDAREAAREAWKLERQTRDDTRSRVQQERAEAAKAERVARRAEVIARDTRSDGTNGTKLHLVTKRVTEGGKVLKDSAWFL